MVQSIQRDTDHAKSCLGSSIKKHHLQKPMKKIRAPDPPPPHLWPTTINENKNTRLITLNSAPKNKNKITTELNETKTN